MFNQDKVTLIMEGNLWISLLTHILPLPWQSMRKKLSNFWFLPCNWKKELNLFALFWLVCSFLSDWFLFCLIRSYGGNGGIVWISGWSPLKTVAVTMASKSCRGATNLWAIGGKKLWAEEYNRAFKTLRRSRAETVREYKTFKGNHTTGNIGWEKHAHMPREQACLERPEKTISIYAMLISEDLSLHRASL